MNPEIICFNILHAPTLKFFQVMLSRTVLHELLGVVARVQYIDPKKCLFSLKGGILHFDGSLKLLLLHEFSMKYDHSHSYNIEFRLSLILILIYI